MQGRRVGYKREGLDKEIRIGYRREGIELGTGENNGWVQEKTMVEYKREGLVTREKGWIQERRVGYKREGLDKEISIGYR